MTSRLIGAAMLIVAATSANAVAAAPKDRGAASPSGLVYLNCTTSQGSSTMDWEITLNEREGIVDYDTGGSGPQRRAARFTQDKVFFIGIELSRIDLSFRRQLSDTEVQTGQCHLAEQKRRAF